MNVRLWVNVKIVTTAQTDRETGSQTFKWHHIPFLTLTLSARSVFICVLFGNFSTVFSRYILSTVEYCKILWNCILYALFIMRTPLHSHPYNLLATESKSKSAKFYILLAPRVKLPMGKNVVQWVYGHIGEAYHIRVMMMMIHLLLPLTCLLAFQAQLLWYDTTRPLKGTVV